MFETTNQVSIIYEFDHDNGKIIIINDANNDSGGTWRCYI